MQRSPVGSGRKPKESVPRIPKVNFFAHDESVAVNPHHVDHSTSLHVHEFFEIVFVERGSLLHRYGAATDLVRANDLLILHPSIPHGYDLTPSGSALIWNVLLTEEALGLISLEAEVSYVVREMVGMRRNVLACRRIRLADEEAAIVGSAIKAMHREYEAKRPGYRLILKGQLLTVLGVAARAMEGSAENEGAQSGGDVVGEVIRFIVEHSDQPLSVSHLAQRAGWSPDHLNRVLRRVTGDTIHEYIGRVRTAKAARLLLTENWTVDRIARHVGYSDARSFRRAFKRYLGVTPAAFRAVESRR